MTDPPVSISFFDAGGRLSGTARAGMTLVFDGSTPRTFAQAPAIERSGDRWRVQVADALDVELRSVAPAAELGSARVHLCHTTGSVIGVDVDCLGVAAETLSPPAWSELDAVRSISALFTPESALFAVAQRPHGAVGHGAEHVAAALLVAGQVVTVSDARISTVYDGDGRQRHVGLELWVEGEDFPRRASGSAHAGASLSLEGLQVNAATFRWRMDGRDGWGGYEVAIRDLEPAAA